MALQGCGCGYQSARLHNVWQLSDAPDLITEGNGDQYIGYEHIGAAYSGGRRYRMEVSDVIFAKEVSRITGDGILLDLACGDGCLAVPCASNGTKIIAADISNTMLMLLQEKAKHNNVNLDQTILCRMNALSIPLADESVDTVVANSVLHLISNPQKVIREIYRILKKGGVFICKDDAPGKISETPFDNTLYFEIVNSLYREYWKKLNLHGIYAKKYSWEFDRNAYCTELFGPKRETIIKRGGVYKIPLKDGFLARFLSRGFSDQVDVPKEIHQTVCEELLQSLRSSYGERFENVTFKGIEQDLVVTVFYK